MLGLLVGTGCLIALVATLRAQRYGRYGYGYRWGGGGAPWGDGCGGPDWGPPWRHRRMGPRSLLRDVFARLDTTPGQEKAILGILDEARERARGLKSGLRASRKEIAALFGSEVLDPAQLEATLEGPRQTVAQLGEELTRTMLAIHEVLDDRQRRALSELLADGTLGRGACGAC